MPAAISATSGCVMDRLVSERHSRLSGIGIVAGAYDSRCMIFAGRIAGCIAPYAGDLTWALRAVSLAVAISSGAKHASHTFRGSLGSSDCSGVTGAQARNSGKAHAGACDPNVVVGVAPNTGNRTGAYSAARSRFPIDTCRIGSARAKALNAGVRLARAGNPYVGITVSLDADARGTGTVDSSEVIRDCYLFL